MAPFSKPETVLKQAEGLVSVEMFSSKRFRSTPLNSLEPIMLRFMELCVEMRKGRAAKEGLMQYKNIAQNSGVGSIEVVLSKFIEMAEAKVKEAQGRAEKPAGLGVDVDDLEAPSTPESILLSSVSFSSSSDPSKGRTDRALVTPSLKFLWESYRTSLETLKNNSRLEGKTEDEKTALAAKVVVSALAISGGSSQQSRLTALLNLAKPPTRAGLLRDALARDVLCLSPPMVKKLYHALEVDFDPLTLCETIAPLLAKLAAENVVVNQGEAGEENPYAPYLPLLHQALLSRLAHLPEEVVFSAAQIESYIMGCARRGELNVRIDHAEGCIIFVDEPFTYGSIYAANATGSEEEDEENLNQIHDDDYKSLLLLSSRLVSALSLEPYIARCMFSNPKVSCISPLHPLQPTAKLELRKEAVAFASVAYGEEEAVATRVGCQGCSAESDDASRDFEEGRWSEWPTLDDLLTAFSEFFASSRVLISSLPPFLTISSFLRLPKDAALAHSIAEAREREASRRKAEVEGIRRQEAEKYAKGLVEGGVIGKEVVEVLDRPSFIVLYVLYAILRNRLAVKKIVFIR
ncbi:hypothetical protein GYMLUDRAFT_63829 [Collybiopsis luxurians FD-317 M1]|uniref:eIF3a PCI domain-containing protein n=1 Tax=Collybiopsis luxurians FD-317 M1 TaxID=944289 RepID=A0A0D0C5N5_9AGAR|nr:hypothetical protein GYMLUDRAFT_63829 [Collybiopsis luxurians FD-317 M1]